MDASTWLCKVSKEGKTKSEKYLCRLEEPLIALLHRPYTLVLTPSLPFRSPQSAQERVMLLTTVLPLITSFLASAALTFDHGLAWSGTYPVASLMGLFVGCIAADLIAIPVYLVGDK